MLRLCNVIMVLLLLGGGFVVYTLEYRYRATERQITKLKKEISEERENMKLLNAEWSYLSQPKRIERLAQTHLGMKPVRADQFVSLEEAQAKLPERPADNPAATERDAIGDILRVLQ